MHKTLLFLFSALLSFALQAQLRNASFEQTDSLGNLNNWELISGKVAQLSSAQFGVIPFPPAQGNYFVLLESDTQTSTIHKAIFEQQFPFNDTPGSFTFQYFYIPELVSQQATVEIIMTKWNGTLRDTVLYTHKPIIAVADSNQIRIQWNPHATTLIGDYRNTMLPDTAIIRFVNDNGTTAGKNIRLYLDALSFGTWAVGLKEQSYTHYTVYPNPANNFICIEGLSYQTAYTLISTDGKQYSVPSTSSFVGQTLDIHSVPDGLYLLSIQGITQTKRILINHEN